MLKQFRYSHFQQRVRIIIYVSKKAAMPPKSDDAFLGARFRVTTIGMNIECK